LIVPYKAEAETRQFLRDIFDVGPEKPMGYVSGSDVRAAGLDMMMVKAMLESATERRVGCYVLEESECHIFGGAIYVSEANPVNGAAGEVCGTERSKK